ncbi:MAG: class I SAM-dependent methyltransferase, partial [Bacteroidetes bacterium]|nr:class I SAM-dependent methyltransferase [Bacteroidota bacterium]
KDQTVNNYKNAEAVLRRITQHKPEHKVKAILDIGAADGKNLSFYRDKAYSTANCYAIEPSENCKSQIIDKNLIFLSSDVNDNWEERLSEKFDLVVMRHVLEHFLEPQIVLRKIHEALSEQGLLYIAVPNSLNPRGSISSFYFRAAHTFYFNFHSLSKLLLSNGFKIGLIQEGDDYN